MSDGDRFETEQLEPNLQSVANVIQSLARSQQHDSMALLALLRMLEGLHRDIRDSLFQESLPDNRRALYSLLKDIEASGGWPYIHRMKLQALLANLTPTSDGDAHSIAAELPLSSKSDASIEGS